MRKYARIVYNHPKANTTTRIKIASGGNMVRINLLSARRKCFPLAQRILNTIIIQKHVPNASTSARYSQTIFLAIHNPPIHSRKEPPHNSSNLTNKESNTTQRNRIDYMLT